MNRHDDGLLWLDEQLRLLGINRAELARRGDFDAGVLANVYNGRRKVGRKLAQRISQGLGVSQTTVFQAFGLLDEEDEPDEEALQLSKLLMDIEDRDERKRTMGIITAVIRQVANASRAAKGQADSKQSGASGKGTRRSATGH